MVVVAKLLPGGVKVTTFSSFIAVLAFYHTLASEPDYLISAASLSAASMAVYSGLSCALLVSSVQGRHERMMTGVKKHTYMNKAGVQLGLTLTQCLLWLSYIAVFVADLYAEYSRGHPSALHCPSARCGNYFFALSFGYVQFFLIFVQLISFGLVVMEIRSSPRRVTSERTLSRLLDRQVDELIHLREETKRARVESTYGAYGRQRSTSLGSMCGAGGRETEESGQRSDHITFTLTADSPDAHTRRRMRTISVESGLGTKQKGILRPDEAKLCVRSRPAQGDASKSNASFGDLSLELQRIRSGGTYRSPSDNGRYPPLGSSDGFQSQSQPHTPKQQRILAALQFEMLDDDDDNTPISVPTSDYFVRRPSASASASAGGGRTLYPLIIETPPALVRSHTSPTDSPAVEELSTPKHPAHERAGEREGGILREPRSSRKGGPGISSDRNRSRPILFDAKNVEFLGRMRA